jgi:hypothetical protein
MVSLKNKNINSNKGSNDEVQACKDFYLDQSDFG